MITNEIKYGGTLQIGDFITIGSQYTPNFGWYAGNGKSGNIQFITQYNVRWEFSLYNKRIASNTINTKDIKGFTFNHLNKVAVRNTHKHRVVKINPEICFTGDDLTHYLEAKQILIDMNFLKQE